MIDFDKPIFENASGRVLVCAHRGVSGGNIPCNSMAAFKAALLQGADMIELDVSKSADGEFYVFHPGMEPAHLCTRRLLGTRRAKSVDSLRFVNQDDTPTQFGIEKLEDVLSFLKGKCYINVDKFWTDIPGITACIRRCGVEKQVVVKTSTKQSYLDAVAELAPDLMFMPMVKSKDSVTEELIRKGVNCIGAEVIFYSESDEVCSPAYIEKMHAMGKVLFADAIVYNYKVQLAAGHSDDSSLINGPETGWGWLADRGFDIIQTDWTGTAHDYLVNRGKR